MIVQPGQPTVCSKQADNYSERYNVNNTSNNVNLLVPTNTNNNNTGQLSTTPTPNVSIDSFYISIRLTTEFRNTILSE